MFSYTGVSETCSGFARRHVYDFVVLLAHHIGTWSQAQVGSDRVELTTGA